MKNFLTLFAITCLLAGCATLSKDECQHANWHIIGMEDGSRGYGLERLGEHRKACARVGVTPDLAAYQAGHAEGVKRYCTPLRGYALGNGGGAYRELCPPDLAKGFRRGYDDGRDMYSHRVRVDQLGATVAATQKSILALEAQIEEREQYIVSDTSTPASRRATLERLKQLREELAVLHEQLFAAEYDRSLAVEDYEALRHYHLQLGY